MAHFNCTCYSVISCSSVISDFMIKQRGMPWMVLQAHLDKIAKVCHKIFQNMPAILRKRGMLPQQQGSNPGPQGRGSAGSNSPGIRQILARPIASGPSLSPNLNPKLSITQNTGLIKMGNPSQVRLNRQPVVRGRLNHLIQQVKERRLQGKLGVPSGSPA